MQQNLVPAGVTARQPDECFMIYTLGEIPGISRGGELIARRIKT